MCTNYAIIENADNKVKFHNTMQFFRNTPCPQELHGSSYLDLNATQKTRWSSPKNFKPISQDENTSLAAKETCASLNSCQFSAQSGSLKEKFLPIDENLNAFDVESQEEEECFAQPEPVSQEPMSSDSSAQDEYATSVMQGSLELASLFKKSNQPTTEIMQTRKVIQVQTLIAPKAKTISRPQIINPRKLDSEQIRTARCSPDFAQNQSQTYA